MKASRKVVLIFILGILSFINIKLIMSLIDTRREEIRLSKKLNGLFEKRQTAENQFILKQDHMRKMLTDKDFMEQITHQKTGYIKDKETVFKFED
ncbi:MAG: hypothetical protein LBI47_03025 [Puniceicoccales bacterium]|jgi:cell division protein FtsB|nr:hypothetical protein [Puniceicoccales bacterium]